MPTYEYECAGCGRRFEIFQNITDNPLERCSQCGSQLKRLIGNGAGIIFKGSGFYQTDYKGKRPQQTSGNGCPNREKDNPACARCNADTGK